MNEKLKKLDVSMKQLTLDLMKYKESDQEYHQTLNSLNKQYQACKVLLALADDGMNNPYYFKCADIGDIETILTNAGYIEQPQKSSTR